MTAIQQFLSRYLITIAALAILCTGMTGCEVASSIASADLPQQYVIAAIPGDRRQDAPVRIFRSSDLQAWPSDVLFLNDVMADTAHGDPSVTFTTAIFGRGGSSPGIGTNGAFYVLAFWGRESTTPIDQQDVSMFVSLSHDGAHWTVPVPVHSTTEVHSNTFGILPRSAIAVAPAGRNGPWFAAYTEFSGEIIVVPLPVSPTGSIDNVTNTAFVETGFGSDQPPALAFLGNNLVLGFWDGSTIQIVQTANGRVWPTTSTTALGSDGSPVQSAGGPPFLYRSGSALELATTRFLPGATEGNIVLLTSTDGITFAEETTIGVGQGLLFGVSAAGPASTQFVVLYPKRLQPNETRLFVSGFPERTITADTAPHQRLSIAGGP